jgi:hypothetical protein
MTTTAIQALCHQMESLRQGAALDLDARLDQHDALEALLHEAPATDFSDVLTKLNTMAAILAEDDESDTPAGRGVLSVRDDVARLLGIHS